MRDPLSGAFSRREFNRRLGLAGAGFALFGPGACARAGGDAADADYETARELDIMVPMRDGIRLATDIHRPARDGVPVEGRFPVLLERTPYGKHLPSRSEVRAGAVDDPWSRAQVADYFVRLGYVVVYQDVRGRYGSEGAYVKYLDDAPDGYDTCAWILEQSWCDGSIGTKGLSYAAHTQGALASAGAPGVAAMFVDSGAFSNSYQGGIRQGGAFELKQATWAYSNGLRDPAVQADPALKAAIEAEDIRAWFARMPWSPGDSPVARIPEYEDYLFEQWTQGNFDDYWKQAGIYAEGFWDQWPDCPQVHMSSWYDAYARTATDNFVGLSARKRGPIRLIMGPWTHGDRSETFAGDVDFGPGATVDGNLAADFWELRRRWFDRWLRDVANGVDEEPTVRYFLMGGGSGRKNAAGRMEHGGRWKTADDWPLPDTAFTRYYLHGDGGLRTEAPASDMEPRSYHYDPRDPVPSIGGTITSGAPIMYGGAFDQRESDAVYGAKPPFTRLADRPDVLVFQTDPLREDVEITGPIEVKLWVSSDAPDTDFTMKLVDVHPPNEDYPEGFEMNITDGILRARYRDSWESPSLMEPSRVYEIRIAPFPTSNLFVAGHRIRLDISSSNYPHFDLNFNTGEPEGQATGSRVARNTVYLDAARPSHVVLPIVPSLR
ncbi:MAG: CocE/NonD family hydrolase [Gemmatimonadota bacterium]